MMAPIKERLTDLRQHVDCATKSLATLMEELTSLSCDDKLEEDYEKTLGDLPYRVIHLKENPFDVQAKQKQSELETLREENKRLKARIKLLETGEDPDVSRRIDDAVNNAHQVELLTNKVAEYKRREEKILDQFRRTSREFREVCYLLTGYKIGVLKGRVYSLTNMYAERDSDRLYIEISPEGELQLLKNEYSDRLSHHIHAYLENADSFPAFLASITLDLFKLTSPTEATASTTTDMSVTMSTTIQPNPDYKPFFQ